LLKYKKEGETMANVKNLIPYTSEQSREEASKNGRKGGEASGKARRAKKNLREALQALLDTTILDEKTGIEMTGTEAVAVKLFQRFLQDGDLKAFELIRDTSGQKPVEKVVQIDIDPDIIAEVEKLVTENDEGTGD
jgi:hypothetical protein